MSEQINATVKLEIDAIKSPVWTLRPLKGELIVELQRSIKNAGLLQPIVVRRVKDGYELVFGNHRLEACKRLGIKRIAAIVANFSEDEAFLARVSENLLRNTYINPLEEAEGYRMLVHKGWSIVEISMKVGKSDSYISERLGILENLSHEIRSHVLDGSLTPSHAEIISRIHDAPQQEKIANLVVGKRLSVHTLENMLKTVSIPTEVQIVRVPGQYVLRIPEELMSAANLHASRSLFVYAKRGRLILERAT